MYLEIFEKNSFREKKIQAREQEKKYNLIQLERKVSRYDSY